MMKASLTLDKKIKAISVIRYRVNDLFNYNNFPSEVMLSQPLTGEDTTIELRIYPESATKKFEAPASAEAYYIAIVSE